MKLLSILVAGAALLAGSTLGTAASTPVSYRATMAASWKSLLSGRPTSLSGLRWHADNVALQTGGTSTPTATPVPSSTATPTPAPTTTANPYPDPVGLLRNAITVYSALRSTHFEIVIDGEQADVEKLHVDAPGDANCKGPSMKGSASASDTLEGTSQSRKLKEKFIQIKTTSWVQTASSKGIWLKLKAKGLTVFSFPIDNPLICPNAPSGTGSGSSSGGTDQLKDLVNLGPSTFKGKPVWHVRGTDVTVDAQGQTSEQQLDFLIGQKPFLPYVFTVSVNDPQNKITLVEKQILTAFGKKVQVKKPPAKSTRAQP